VGLKLLKVGGEGVGLNGVLVPRLFLIFHTALDLVDEYHSDGGPTEAVKILQAIFVRLEAQGLFVVLIAVVGKALTVLLGVRRQ
jgi:hypothetical protein